MVESRLHPNIIREGELNLPLESGVSQLSVPLFFFGL